MKAAVSLAFVLLVVLLTPITASASPKVLILSERSGVDGNGAGAINSININNAFATEQPISNLSSPQTFAVAPDQSKVYITDRSTNLIYVYDANTSEQIGTISVENDGEMAVTSDGTKGYIGSGSGLHVLDLTQNIVSDTIPLYYTFYNAISTDGTKLLVGNGDTLEIINTATDTVTSSLLFNDYFLADFVTNRSSNKVYISLLKKSSSSGEGVVAVYDLTTSQVTNYIPVGNGPESLALSRDDAKLYIVNRYDKSVSIINTETETVTTTISLGVYSDVGSIAVSLAGLNAYVPATNEDGSTTVIVINILTDTILRTISMPEAYSSFGVGLIDTLGFTTAGTNVSLSPEPGFDITFDSVATNGVTSVEKMDEPPVPSGYSLSNDSLFFDISSSASFSGTVEVCINYTDETNEGTLKFLHEEDGIWVDRTSSLDTVNNILCGNVTSFSKFLIALPDSQPTIEDLIAKVQEINSNQGIINSLDSKLAAAKQALTDLNNNNDQSAVEKLNAFKNEVLAQRGVKISEADADILLQMVNAILSLL